MAVPNSNVSPASRRAVPACSPSQQSVPPYALNRPQPETIRTTRIDRLDPIGAVWGQLNATQKAMLLLHGVAIVAASYHGYRRNRNSIAWGLVWGTGGLLCPTVTMGFALTQGYAQRKA